MIACLRFISAGLKIELVNAEALEEMLTSPVVLAIASITFLFIPKQSNVFFGLQHVHHAKHPFLIRTQTQSLKVS